MIGHANDQQARSLILCVEDEPDLRRDIADELSEAGYAVIEACDGWEALDLLDASRPDLILCDISMPGLSGYDVLRSVRAKGPDYAETPFVFLSALSDPREIVEGKRLGADDYLVKPIDYDLLLATVDARLRQIAPRCAAPSDCSISSAVSPYSMAASARLRATSSSSGSGAPSRPSSSMM